jgi:ribosomal protein S18 acetylase RimI-like enzyme
MSTVLPFDSAQGKPVATVRRAGHADLPVLGELGALLMRTHYEFDHQRFMACPERAEAAEGYAWFLGSQLEQERVAIFVAEREGEIVGYVYAGIEPQSWKELRDECGYIHDVVVHERGRGMGVATQLIQVAAEWLATRGMPRVVLWTAAKNTKAQRLFERLGFRRTMIEMTREL